MSYYIFVDNSNVWIEGKYHSAINKGFAANIYEAHEKAIQDNSVDDLSKPQYAPRTTKQEHNRETIKRKNDVDL